MARLAIVLTGRNDEHGGNFTQRLLTSIEQNSRLLAGAGIDFEYVWVEWNPPADRPLLAEELTRRWGFVRSFVVGAEVHRQICENPNMPILEFFAKNAGVRRAGAEWILTSNADILLSTGVVNALGRLRPDEPIVYRAVRHDLRAGAGTDRRAEPESWQFVHHTTPPYHAEGAGDFLLASRDTYHALRGFNETIRHAKLHKDTQFCIHAGKLGAAIEVLGPVYHLYHPNSWVNLPANDRVAVDAPWGPPYQYRSSLPYLNPSGWGLAGYGEEPLGERVVQLSKNEAWASTEGPFAETSPQGLWGAADEAWRSARRMPLGEFRGAYVAGLARFVRSQPDPAAPAVAYLRRYVETFWRSLLADERIGALGVALYGAGRHTEWLLRVIDGCKGPKLRALLDDYARTEQPLHGLAVLRPEELDPATVGAVVISSDRHEARIAARCRELFGTRVPVLPLYDGLPTGVYLDDPS